MEEDIIIKEIERLRRRMEVYAEMFGLNHCKVIKLSQEIDVLHTKLVKQQKIKRTKNEVNYVQKKKNNFIKEICFAWS